MWRGAGENRTLTPFPELDFESSASAYSATAPPRRNYSPAALRPEDFSFSLPDALIARQPLAHRRHSRLMVLAGTAPPAHRLFPDILGLLREGDLLVGNDSRVVPARLLARRDGGASVELLLERIASGGGLARIRANRSPRPGTRLWLRSPGLWPPTALRVLDRAGELFHIAWPSAVTPEQLLLRYGRVPLPPYLRREAQVDDWERYQTVYARHPGSVAAPTAGLHFDAPLLEQLQRRGVELGWLSLHIGGGTFAPLRMAVDGLMPTQLYPERVAVGERLCAQVAATRARGGRVVAIGTTVARALESACVATGHPQPLSAETRLFIRPGFEFRCVDALLSNFHLPNSSLLMLVAALVGRERLLAAYAEAVRERYRFYSYGDAMLILDRSR